jgi:hypothetical protein
LTVTIRILLLDFFLRFRHDLPASTSGAIIALFSYL